MLQQQELSDRLNARPLLYANCSVCRKKFYGVCNSCRFRRIWGDCEGVGYCKPVSGGILLDLWACLLGLPGSQFRQDSFPVWHVSDAEVQGDRKEESPVFIGSRASDRVNMWPDGEFKPSDAAPPAKMPDPSVHTLAPITILANYDRPKNGGTKTEMDDFVHAKYKSQQHGEFSSVITNGSTTPLVREKVPDEESGYNPFAHRKVDHPMSNLDTLIHLLKGSLGSGILAMPLAFANAGLLFGVFATILVGVICTYCVHMLVSCAHILYRRMKVPTLDYSGVAEAAFLMGPTGVRKYRRLAKACIDTFLVIDLYGCCCVYVVFVSRNLKQVVDFQLGSHYDIRLYMACLLLPLILMNLIHNLKWLAPFSMIANILMATGIGISFYYIFKDLPEVSDQKYFASFQQLPLFFGTAIFALEGIGVVMPLENNMKTPQKFIGCPGVLNIGMASVVSLYTAVGFFGYLRFGDKTEASITLNLPEDELLAQSVKIMIAITIFLTYSLQFYVPMGILWKGCKHWFPKNEVLAEYILRIFLIVLSVGIAAAVPNLGPFISLVGAMCLSTLGLIFPAVIEMVTFWEKPGMGKYNWRIWKNVFLILFGVLGFATGTITSLKEISESFGKE